MLFRSVMTVEDVTTEVRDRARIRDQRDRLESVVEHLPVVLFSLDPEGTFTFSEGRGLERLGLEPGELEGQSVFDLYADNPDIIDACERALDGETTQVTQAVEGRAFDTQYQPIVDDGDLEQVIGVSLDVTDRVEKEHRLERSNERLGRFAYVASHDLQEPLRTVSNYVELLADEYADDLDEDGERFVEVIVTGSQRMQSMINGLLDYSRVTTRGEEFESVDAEAAVAAAMDDIGVLLDEHEGGVEWGDLPTVEADGDQLRRLFQNLVTNAFEHGGEGPIHVDIDATDTGDAYRFAVADDGAGIAENRREKIFRIFKSGVQYQTSSQAKGIGLAVCDNIAQRHGGRVWVESDPGEGATFYFTVEKSEDH